MIRTLLTAAVATLALVTVSSSDVEAQMLCKERSEVLAQLGIGYKEAPTAMGLASNGTIIEVLTSPDGKTWTIIITQPNGVSCVMATGESWETLEKENTDPAH